MAFRVDAAGKRLNGMRLCDMGSVYVSPSLPQSLVIMHNTSNRIMLKTKIDSKYSINPSKFGVVTWVQPKEDVLLNEPRMVRDHIRVTLE